MIKMRMMDAIKYGKVREYLSNINVAKYLNRGYIDLNLKLYKSAIDNFFEILNVPMITAVNNLIKRDKQIYEISHKKTHLKNHFEFCLDYSKQKEQEALLALEGLVN